MPSKRTGDADGSLRKRIGAASRTGQACDRCKVRKIRCDARPGGCSPCLQNNSECKTTDRITGRAVQRGHTETIELENNNLRVYMLDLQQQLRDSGIEPKQAPAVLPSYMQTTWTEQSQQQWGDVGSDGLGTTSRPERSISQSSGLPDFRTGCIGDNYLGVSTGKGVLSPIEGSRLSLFDIKLDLADFLPPEVDPLSDPTSYHTFLRISTGQSGTIPEPAIPPYEEAKFWADHFFKAVLPFVPIVHRPDFMELLGRNYPRHFEPTLTDKVLLHMMFGIMHFQAALRSDNEPTKAHLKAQATAHYHYSISFIPDLFLGHSLEHIQALTLICLQLRQQPRLGAAWSFTNTVLGLAIELGLHRSADAWQSSTEHRNSHAIEMRKRVFWSLLVIQVTIGGKLGRPMPLRLQDMDIEMPETLSDNLSSETGLSKWRKCSFRAAIPGMKLLKILMQVYATVYSVRPDHEPYEITVRRLEKELDILKEQTPPELSGGPQTATEDRVQALYLQTAEEEIRLILHHPALNQRVGPDVFNKNLDICLDASRKLLATASELQTLNALDTTWYYSTDYVAAIFTTLFAWCHRQDQMSNYDYGQLRDDMNKWVNIMGVVGSLLGSGWRLRDYLSHHIDTRMASMSLNLANRAAPASLTSSESPISPAAASQNQSLQQLQQTEQSPPYPATSSYPNAFVERAPSMDHPNMQHQVYPAQQPASHGHPLPGYHAPNHYYQDAQQPMNVPNYPGMGHFDANVYHQTHASTPIYDASMPVSVPMAPTPPQHQHPAHPVQHPSAMAPPPLPMQQQQTPPIPSPYVPAYQPPPAHHPAQNGYHQPPPAQVNMYPGATAWRAFADTTMMNVAGHDYVSSATAHMSLQNDSKQPMAGMGLVQMAHPQDQHTHWPLVQYHG